jgi:hypothetical protein
VTNQKRKEKRNSPIPPKEVAWYKHKRSGEPVRNKRFIVKINYPTTFISFTVHATSLEFIIFCINGLLDSLCLKRLGGWGF